MKTVRIILPVMAILFAVAGALASINSPKQSLAIQEISIRDASCEPDGFCNNNTVSDPCMYENKSLDVDLYIPGSPSPVCQSVNVTGLWQEEP